MQRFVQLIDDKERFEHTPLNTTTTFTFRRLPADERVAMERRLAKEYRDTPEAMTPARTEAVFRYCVLDWDGVVGLDGKDTPFNPDLLIRLPEPVRISLLNAINAKTTREVEDEDLGNSDATPPTE